MMQKKGMWLPIYSVPSNVFDMQKLHEILEDLAQEISEPKLSETINIIDYVHALID